MEETCNSISRRTFLAGGAILAATVAGGSLFGCSGSTGSSSASEESSASNDYKVLRVGSGASRINAQLDVADYATYNYFGLAAKGIGECLFHLDDTLTPEYWLCTDLSTTDYATWTLKLRDDVTFQNGNKLTAKAVKRCLERTLKDFALAAESLTISSMEAVDDTTLKMTLPSAQPGLMSTLCDTMFMIYDFPEGDDVDFNKDSSYTGPYMIEATETDVQQTLMRFEDYWRGKPLIDEIDYIMCEDLTASLKAGDIDLAQSTAIADCPEFESSSEFVLSAQAVPRGEQFWFNDNKVVASDPAIRTAVNLCLDRDAIVKDCYYGMAAPTYGIYPDYLSFGGTDGLNLIVDEFNPSKAAQVLADAGWAAGPDGVLMKDGNRAELNVVSYADKSLLAVGDMLASEMKKIGVVVNVTGTKDTRTYETEDNFDMILITYGMCMIGNPYYWNNTMVASTASSNTGHYNNPEVDKLIADMNAEPDTAKRDKICKEIQQHMIDDQHWIVFAHKMLWSVTNDKVENFKQSPCQYYLITNELDMKS